MDLRTSGPGSDVWGAPPSLKIDKNTENGVRGGFFLTSNVRKICRVPHELMTPPQTLSQMVRGQSSPYLLPLDAFGVSISAPTE